MRLAFTAYVAALHVFLLVLVLKTNFWLLAEKTFGWIPPEEWSDGATQRLLARAREDRKRPPGMLVLLGDSLIQQLDETLVADDAINLGISGNTVHNLLLQLPVLRSIETARAIVLAIGVNDLKYRPVSDVARDYGALLDRLSAASKRIVVSVLPVNERSSTVRSRPYLRNSILQSLNHELRSLCDAHEGCFFLDTWPAMLDESGADLRRELAARDGWHLSQSGNRCLARLLVESLDRTRAGAHVRLPDPPCAPERQLRVHPRS